MRQPKPSSLAMKTSTMTILMMLQLKLCQETRMTVRRLRRLSFSPVNHVTPVTRRRQRHSQSLRRGASPGVRRPRKGLEVEAGVEVGPDHEAGLARQCPASPGADPAVEQAPGLAAGQAPGRGVGPGQGKPAGAGRPVDLAADQSPYRDQEVAAEVAVDQGLALTAMSSPRRGKL